jgi:hypothetical protein
MLPNLSSLLLDTCNVSHFPILKALFEREYVRGHPNDFREYGFSSWEHSYPREVFACTTRRLHSLELPLKWSDLEIHSVTPRIRDIRALSSLRHVNVPHLAIHGSLYHGFGRPAHILPATLEMLTINIIWSSRNWTEVAVPPILWLLFKRRSFPKLRKIMLVALG